MARAAESIGDLTDREVLIAGAIAYWCEGSKRRPPVNYERVIFVNSDPGCLRISVYRSGALYRRIEGWASAAMSAT